MRTMTRPQSNHLIRNYLRTRRLDRCLAFNKPHRELESEQNCGPFQRVSLLHWRSIRFWCGSLGDVSPHRRVSVGLWKRILSVWGREKCGSSLVCHPPPPPTPTHALSSAVLHCLHYIDAALNFPPAAMKALCETRSITSPCGAQ